MNDREADYKEKLEKDFPGIQIVSFEKIGEGWDNEAYLVNKRTVFRIPKLRSLHQLKERIEHTHIEIATLRKLEGKLSVITPKIDYVSEDESYYGYSYSHGEQLNLTVLNDPVEFVNTWINAVTEISEHISLEEAKDISIKEFSSNDYRLMRSNEAISSGVLNKHLRHIAISSVRNYKEGWEDAIRVVVHGDLGLGNWVYDNKEDKYTIIDWSDVCIAPQEFQIYRLIDELPEHLDLALDLYESKTGIRLSKKLIYDCGVISNLSMIGALIEKEGMESKHVKRKLKQLERWILLEH